MKGLVCINSLLIVRLSKPKTIYSQFMQTIKTKEAKMFNPVKKKWNLHKKILLFLGAASLIWGLNAQSDSADTKLLDEYLASKGYSNTIVFDSSNIKQFWANNTVASKDNLINILINNLTSDSLRLQLANVNAALDCKVDVITSQPIFFKVVDTSQKVLSISNKENDFLNYHIYSSIFHLETLKDFTFNLIFAPQDNAPIITIKK